MCLDACCTYCMAHVISSAPIHAGASQQVGEEHGGTEWAARAEPGHARPAAPDGECHPVWQPSPATGDSSCILKQMYLSCKSTQLVNTDVLVQMRACV